MYLAATPIPFRSDPVVSGDYLLWIGVVTVGLLMLVAIILLQMRRRGWLDAWTSGNTGRHATQATRWHVQSQRISRRTTVHTLQRPGCELLVVESAHGLSVTALAPDTSFRTSVQGEGEVLDGR